MATSDVIIAGVNLGTRHWSGTSRPVPQPLRLTRRERDALILIEKAIETTGKAPSIREFRAALKTGSTEVLGLLGRLERKHRIRREPVKARAITIINRWEPGEEPAGSMKDVAISLRRMADRLERARA